MQQIKKTFQGRQPIHIIPEILKLEDEDPVIIQDQSQLNSMIASFKQKIQDLIAEIYQLTIEKERDHSEHEVILQKLREDHNKYSAEIERYRSEINNIQQIFTTDKERIEQQKEREKRSTQKKDLDLETNKASELVDIQKKIDELTILYQEQHKYEVMEKDYKEQIKQLKQIHTQAQYKHHDAMNFQEKKQTKQNQNVKSRNQLTKKDTLKNAHIDAEKEVIEEQKQAFDKNCQLKEKLLEYEKELERIKKEREQVSKKNREVKINASINLEGYEQYKAVGALQLIKIKSYKDKVQSMKSITAEEVAAKSKSIQTIKEKYYSKIQNLKEQLNQTKIQYNKKCKQHAIIKQLAHTILQQRSQVQQFFLIAMQHVGEQAKQLPKDSSTNKTYKQKVDISQLDMVDKQKILRTLFTRVSIGTKKDLITAN